MGTEKINTSEESQSGCHASLHDELYVGSHILDVVALLAEDLEVRLLVDDHSVFDDGLDTTLGLGLCDTGAHFQRSAAYVI